MARPIFPDTEVVVMKQIAAAIAFLGLLTLATGADACGHGRGGRRGHRGQGCGSGCGECSGGQCAAGICEAGDCPTCGPGGCQVEYYGGRYWSPGYAQEEFAGWWLWQGGRRWAWLPVDRQPASSAMLAGSP